MSKKAIPGFLQRLLTRRTERTAIDALQQLDPHLMRDVGVSPREIPAVSPSRRDL